MGEYFQGWRRKTGVVTLVMSCVFMAGWVRSFSIADSAWSETSQFISLNGGIFCEVSRELFNFNFSFHSQDQKWVRHAYSHPTMVQIWRWRGFGFAYGVEDGEVKKANGTTSRITVDRYYFPYWSIVIPLTLVSLWLLLFKPRPTTPTKLIEPIPETVCSSKVSGTK